MKIRKCWVAEFGFGSDLHSICMRVPKENYYMEGRNSIQLDVDEMWIDGKVELGKEVHLRLSLLDYNSLIKLYDALGKYLNEN